MALDGFVVLDIHIQFLSSVHLFHVFFSPYLNGVQYVKMDPDNREGEKQQLPMKTLQFVFQYTF